MTWLHGYCPACGQPRGIYPAVGGKPVCPSGHPQPELDPGGGSVPVATNDELAQLDSGIRIPMSRELYLDLGGDPAQWPLPSSEPARGLMQIIPHDPVHVEPGVTYGPFPHHTGKEPVYDHQRQGDFIDPMLDPAEYTEVTATLSQHPDTSLPHFPPEDFGSAVAAEHWEVETQVAGSDIWHTDRAGPEILFMDRPAAVAWAQGRRTTDRKVRLRHVIACYEEVPEP
jgi:hypothetical protein